MGGSSEEFLLKNQEIGAVISDMNWGQARKKITLADTTSPNMLLDIGSGRVHRQKKLISN